MQAILDDLRYATRRLRRSPGFTIVAIVTLALGIGANVTLFGFASTLLLKPLAAREPEHLVRVFSGRHGNMPYDMYAACRDQNRTLSGLAAFQGAPLSLRTGQDPEPIYGMSVSGNYFDVLGVAPTQGRLLAPSDDDPGAAGTIVLSHAFWQRRFEGDPAAVNRTITINGQPHTIVGIAPPRFAGTMSPIVPDVYVPMRGPAKVRQRSVLTVGRLQPGVTRAQALADLTPIVTRWNEGKPAISRTPVSVYAAGRLVPEIERAAQVFMGFLMALAGLVLLVACANLSSLQLTRALTRGQEIGIRVAVGAGRGRLVRLLLGESILLAVAGGLGAAAAAALVGQVITRLPLPIAVPMAFEFTFDWRVVLFAVGVSLAATLLFGLVPALHATRTDVSRMLKEGAASARGGSRLRSGLVTAQIALSALLLFVGALLARSVTSSRFADKQLDTTGVLTAAVELDTAGYERRRGQEFQRTLLQRLAEDPTVSAAALVQDVPLTGNSRTGRFVRDGETLDGAIGGYVNRVSHGAFGALGIPLLAGRDFGPTDVESAAPVAIVNETFAQRAWPGESPIGKRLRTVEAGGLLGRTLEIVGMARQSKYVSVGEERRAFVYEPLLQSYVSGATLLVKTAGPPMAALPAVRAHMRALDPNLPLSEPRSLESATGLTVLPVRIAAWLAGALGAIALALVVIGLYGLMSHFVQQRAHDTGVRIALGAPPPLVVRGLTRHGLRLTAVGLGIGLAAAVAVGLLLQAAPLGLSGPDPLSFLAVVLVLAATAYIACLVPAWRAVRADPVSSLRAE